MNTLTRDQIDTYIVDVIGLQAEELEYFQFTEEQKRECLEYNS